MKLGSDDCSNTINANFQIFFSTCLRPISDCTQHKNSQNDHREWCSPGLGTFLHDYLNTKSSIQLTIRKLKNMR